MDLGNLDRWYGTTPPPVINDSKDIKAQDRWYGTVPSPVQPDAAGGVVVTEGALVGPSCLIGGGNVLVGPSNLISG